MSFTYRLFKIRWINYWIEFSNNLHHAWGKAALVVSVCYEEHWIRNRLNLNILFSHASKKDVLQDIPEHVLK